MSREGLKKQGFLYKLPVKGLMKKWTKRWFVLYWTTHEGVVRLEYYDNPESMVTSSGKRTIPLRECSDISSTIGSKIHPYAFQFTSQLGHHVFASETQPEVDNWMDSIREAIHDDKVKRRRSKAQSMVFTSSGSDIAEGSEHGISYKNKVDSGTYRVTVEENETSRKMNLSGIYNLELRPSKLALTAPSGATIFTLSYKFLKNYGKQSGQFHFETGRNSPIGQGKLVLVTTCSKEIFGVVHTNIKRLKDQAIKKQSSSGAVSKPSQGSSDVALRIKKPPPPKKQQAAPQSSGRTSIGSRPSSRHSTTEIAAESVPGTYHSSKNLEEESGNDPSALYAVVDKSKKTSARKKEAPQISPTHDAKTTGAQLGVDPFDTILRNRMSTMVVEVGEEVFDDSFDEDQEDSDDDVDGGYDENLEPLAEGVQNPFDEDNFAQENGQTSFNDPSDKRTGETVHAKSDDLPSLNEIDKVNNTPTAQVQQEKEYASSESAKKDKKKTVKDLDFGFGAGNLEPMPKPSSGSPGAFPVIMLSEDSTSNAVAGSNQGGLEFGASPSKGQPTEEKPTATHNISPLVTKPEDPGSQKDLGSGPTSFSPTAADQKDNAAQPTEGTKALNDVVNLLGDIDFSMGSLNNPQDPSATAAAGNDLPMPDLNFDFGDLPAISGVGNDPFSNFSSPPLPSGNIAELDFGTLDNNFFESLDGKNQHAAGGQGAPAFDVGFSWGDDTTL